MTVVRTACIAALTTLLLIAAVLAFRAAPAGAMASHVGWPDIDGMLLMNKNDDDRPLDARAGHDPFGGQDAEYRCDEIHLHSPSCFDALVPVLPTDPLDLADLLGTGRHKLDPSQLDARTALGLGLPLVVGDAGGHDKLLGGHGDDTIHAGDDGDVLWGDYKPCCQPSRQRDVLTGGAGPDFIYASHGRNTIAGGGGTDIVHAHFGHGTIDCGAGRDIVYVHGAHPHRFKLTNCEVVSSKTGESAPRWALKKLPWY